MGAFLEHFLDKTGQISQKTNHLIQKTIHSERFLTKMKMTHAFSRNVKK